MSSGDKNDGYVTRGACRPYNPIRRMVIESPSQVAQLILTEEQSYLMRKIMKMGCTPYTSRRLADEVGVSVQAASGQLSKLWCLGYLERRESIAGTGGIIHLYRSAI